ncbi:hypothetical protein ABW19_dt0209087 [Dactylella cylindrospora]|nr:hypothetical protein ABW19_dt0209087 [Dactylella cylindrospora]
MEQNSRAKRLTDADWQEYRELIEDLYCNHGVTQSALRDRLKEVHGFDVNRRQLEHRLKEWGIFKNVKECDYRLAHQQIAVRFIADPKKPTHVTLGGVTISKKKLTRARKRYRIKKPDPVLDANSTTPYAESSSAAVKQMAGTDSKSAITCHTPPPCEILTVADRFEALKLDTLPIVKLLQALPQMAHNHLARGKKQSKAMRRKTQCPKPLILI